MTPIFLHAIYKIELISNFPPPSHYIRSLALANKEGEWRLGKKVINRITNQIRNDCNFLETYPYPIFLSNKGRQELTNFLLQMNCFEKFLLAIRMITICHSSEREAFAVSASRPLLQTATENEGRGRFCVCPTGEEHKTLESQGPVQYGRWVAKLT